MPYKSLAQERYFHAAEARGDMPKKVVDEFDNASAGMDLPAKVSKTPNPSLVKKFNVKKSVSMFKPLAAVKPMLKTSGKPVSGPKIKSLDDLRALAKKKGAY